MGVFSNLRGPRTGSIRENLPICDRLSSSSSLSLSSSSSSSWNIKWSKLLPICFALVVIAEIGFLCRLDRANNAALVDSFADFFYGSSRLLDSKSGFFSEHGLATESCEEWLGREDSVVYSRNFNREPVLVAGDEKEWQTCAVGCTFESDSDNKPDAAFGLARQPGTLTVIRSMESTRYYSENNIAQARRRGYDVVMTTSLSSDVPVGYFSWAEYDIMAPVQPKTEKALVAAFISNCRARNFGLQALEALMKTNVKIDSYGGCHRNRDGRVDKVEALKSYKFSLAFENSNEEDYVTEKFFQSLVAGSVPVVLGAPNIEEFAPASGSLLHIKQLEDVESVAKRMEYLAEKPEAYNQTLRWKFEGPSDSFKALVDMAAVHSSCRLCIHLATMIWEKEEKSPKFKKRPCKCLRGLHIVYHLYVRERGRFEMESVFLRDGNLTLGALESAVHVKFKSLKHVPVWKKERPEIIRGNDELKIYKIYPLGLTQRQALYNFRFNGDSDFEGYVLNNLCAKFEVIFV